jgi:hypothetical protein
MHCRQSKTKVMAKKKPKPHIVEYVKSGSHSDQYKCSCGWISEGYWDLESAAFDEWLLHAYDVKQEIRPSFVERQSTLVADRAQTLARLEAQKKRIDKQIKALKPKS